MGMFMTSLAFRATKEAANQVKQKLGDQFLGLDGLIDNLDSEGPGYAILSPYGDMGMILDELAEELSSIIGGYAILASCIDSDFNMMALFHNGELVEECAIGEVYEEYQEMGVISAPDLDRWKPLLLDPTQEDALRSALYGDEVLAEDSLRALSSLIGMPVFSDEMMMQGI